MTSVHWKQRRSVFPGSDGYKQLSETTPQSSTDSATLFPRLPLEVNVKSSLKGTKARAQLVPVHEGSPWEIYTKYYGVELGSPVVMAYKKNVTVDLSAPPGPEKLLFPVRSFSGLDAEEKLYMIRQIQHENIHHSYEIFAFGNAFYVISQYVAISLDEVIACPAYPDECQLAAIIAQVLKGISFLSSQNLMHGHITCSKILLTPAGVVKIANPESCRKIDQQRGLEKMKDIEALGFVMMRLMEKDKDNSKFGLDEPDRWSEDAVNFLLLTMSASPEELASHTFLKGSSRIEKLVVLVAFAQTSAYRFYSNVS
ncbi:MAG: hypothetical protein M1813_009682 [Trichoglossum hirsutum]|nr:MAG: hypothetical protein M1813_009682 [Trichoglossum hirsutum]